ncbi:Ras guanine nucleotide exchange factor, putative [Entamoeba histolytica HM-3:IMSS]|uniref:Ras guanine nucleotide exchange factor, putative n=1 Tax=Entamoeba histolytica HM-3:IMSS TaxID=885315 RepID=M7VXE8_ENTHI|nr:Ras guanine nucleotide exchange factor, putative [Entamoeba histolytica HM-3:IMSS]
MSGLKETQIDDVPFVNEVEDKKNWEEKVMTNHPEVLQLAEETRFLEGLKDNWQNTQLKEYSLPSFARNLSENKVVNPDTLPEEEVIALICQYLKEQKLQETRIALVKEVLSKHPQYQLLHPDSPQFVNYTSDPSLKDALEGMVKLGLTDADNLFEKLPFEEEDFAKLPDEEYDQHISFHTSTDTDIPITDENIVPNNNCEIILEKCSEYPDGIEIPAAMSTNQLILFTMTSTDVYLNKFLTVYRDFITPIELLNKFIQIKDQNIEKFKYIISYWIEHFSSDFTTQMVPLLTELEMPEFTDDIIKSKLGKVASNFDKFNLILKDHETLKQYFPSCKMDLTEQPQLPNDILSNKLYLKDIDPTLIAQALCIIDQHLYDSISSSEFVMATGTHISAVLKFYNIAVEWLRQSLFSERILPDSEKASIGMQKVKEKFMDIWMKLYDNKDFHSMAVFATVFNSADHKKEFQNRFSNRKVDAFTLPTMFDSKSCYSNYRKGIDSCVSSKQPFVPFIGITLHHISSIRCGLDTTIENGKINFLKYNSIYNCIEQFNLYKKLPYQFTPVYQIISLILRGMSEVEYMVDTENN